MDQNTFITMFSYGNPAMVNVKNLYADKQLHLLKLLANMAPRHVILAKDSQNYLDTRLQWTYQLSKGEDRSYKWPVSKSGPTDSTMDTISQFQGCHDELEIREYIVKAFERTVNRCVDIYETILLVVTLTIFLIS